MELLADLNDTFGSSPRLRQLIGKPIPDEAPAKFDSTLLKKNKFSDKPQLMYSVVRDPDKTLRQMNAVIAHVQSGKFKRVCFRCGQVFHGTEVLKHLTCDQDVREYKCDEVLRLLSESNGKSKQSSVSSSGSKESKAASGSQSNRRSGRRRPRSAVEQLEADNEDEFTFSGMASVAASDRAKRAKPAPAHDELPVELLEQFYLEDSAALPFDHDDTTMAEQ